MWTAKPACCASPELERDERFETQPGPTSSRVVVCSRCKALAIEEWMVLWVGDSERDDFRYLAVSYDEASARFDKSR